MYTTYLYNNDTVSHTWGGQMVQSASYYLVQACDVQALITSDQVLDDINNDLLIISTTNSSGGHIAGHVNQWNYLNGIDPAPRDTDGSPLSRVKITKTGNHYQLHCIEFKSSKRAIEYSKKEDNTDLGFATMRAYKLVDSVETLITDDNDLQYAVKTIIDWEPTHNYDIMGAFLFQDTVPTTNVRMWCVGVPDIAEQYGGSKAFVTGGLNMKFLGVNESIRVDGRAPKTMEYSATYHTNKFSMTFRHDAGVQHSMLLMFELFKF